MEEEEEEETWAGHGVGGGPSLASDCGDRRDQRPMLRYHERDDDDVDF